MKERISIGILSRWNATCGVALHAELIGREFVKSGIDIKVFAPYLDSANKWWHHISTAPDEAFVIRCFTEISPEGSEGSIDIDKILRERIDGLIVESWPSLPKKDVEVLVWNLRKKGVPSVAVIHDGFKKDLTYGSLDIFKKVVVFHEGYKEIIKDKVSEEKIEIIPYPCIPPVERRERRFAEDGNIVFFSFGRQPIQEYEDYIKALEKISERYPVQYRVIRGSELLPYNYSWLLQSKKVLQLNEIYDNLQKIDIHLIPKGDTKAKVVSSTLCQTLGSLAIHVAPDTAYFEDVKRCKNTPVLLYRDRQDLVEKIEKTIREPEFREMLTNAAKRYAEENCAYNVAMRILALIDPVFVKDIKQAVNF
ncbi:MAG: glycosyltransferase family 1 protein [Deltaproteobacteria bacterium]|nr:MAG: glycosyltransferase family 1 protein [Deltaproteobacteria bacterium]